MVASKIDTVNYWNDEVPAKFHGSTVIVLHNDQTEPTAFWLGSNEGKAFYSCSANQRVYDLGNPNSVFRFMKQQAQAAARTSKREIRYFNIVGDKGTRSLQDHYVDAVLAGRIKQRIKEQNFHLRGGALVMGTEDDDLLAALDIADDEPDKPKQRTRRQEDDDALPPHRRLNPPNKIREPKAYLDTLKRGKS